ncbi:helix-turn-helix domain-containing protein [Methanobacterium sp. YSL]|nr:helix-turn-helix domain-containing protein [Methanobacterium sp. YSL]
MAEVKLYTVEEIAEILRVTERTIYNYIKEEDLPAIKIGKHWRVRHEHLEQFLEKKVSTQF